MESIVRGSVDDRWDRVTSADGWHTDADPRSELAQELRRVRIQSGRSLKELEPITASSDSSLSRYLSGASIPPWSVVDALYRTAGRDPADLAPLWEAAQRTRFERRAGERARGRETGEPSEKGRGQSDAADAADAAGAAARSASRSEHSGAGTPAPPERPDRSAREVLGHGRRTLLFAVVGVVAAVAAVLSVAAFISGTGPAPTPTRAGTAGPGSRVCPWHYVAADEGSAPIPIADSAGPESSQVGIYEPGQVFYVPEPPAKRQNMMKTLDGWVTADGSIQRSSGPCLDLANVAPARIR